MDNSQSLSVILPVYNEEQNIKNVVKKIAAGINNYTDTFELIIVNDGSTDKSGEILKNLASQCSFIRFIHCKNNKGYGAAISKGIAVATKEWTLIMDADGQFRINELKNFWDRKSSYDFIIGYRKRRSDNLYRRVLGKTGNFIANLFLKTNTPIQDINCGFKLFKTNELKTIPIISNGAIISFEILYRLLENKRLFAQLPVTHYKRIGGKSTGGRFNIIMQIILESIKLISNK